MSTSGLSTSRVPLSAFVARLRERALRGLARMYRPAEGLFAFRIRRSAMELILEGVSPRYTAIALIGLAGEDEAVQRSILAGRTAQEACARLLDEPKRSENLGDVALALWAASATGYAERQSVVENVLALRPADASHPTVEVAWTLGALCADLSVACGPLRKRLADRLIASYERGAGMFPHRLGGRELNFRDHVCCFADLVYPVHALARYAEVFGDAESRDVATHCAGEICSRQGPDGQWWWHYDRRTGDVIERYPVYAVHQDAMAPMALLAVENAAGVDLRSSIDMGLAWLAQAPELGGGSLVDDDADLIWRKVARREPAKLSRYLQAAASRLNPAMRTPGLDGLFPPGAVDYEDRPYHLGWVLHAWTAGRAVRWDARAATL
jgi:hypothetical protein